MVSTSAILAHFDDPDVLAHYGVKGMKWGVRRDLKRMNPKDRPAYIEKKDAKWVQDTLTNHKKSAKVIKRTIRDTKTDNLSTELRYKEQGYKFGPNVLNKSNIKNRQNRAALNSFNKELDSNYKNNLDRHLNKTFGQSPTRLKEARIEPIAGGVGYRVHIVESDNPKLAKQFSKIANKDKKREAKAKRIIEKEKKKKLSEARKLKHSEVDLDSLMHHGVKGMKWGIRKDRRKGGVRKGKIADPKKATNAGRVSSTDAAKVIARSTAKGAKKVSDIVRNSKAYKRTLGAEDEANRIRREAASTAIKAVDTYKQHRDVHGRDRSINKRYRNMSDDDMRRAINRLKLEREYDTLIADRRKQNQGVAGKIADWGKDTTKSIATDVVKKQFKNLGDEILSEALGIDNKSREEKKKKKNDQS